MSGKTIYIRSIALLQIMAQIGSFVPADYASFPIIHSIFARLSMDDNIEANLSSFSLEMREMAFILRNIEGNSMAIIDELGRSTSTSDGLAIALAMSEALVQSKASVWFATHFVELAHILADRPGVLNLQLAWKNTKTESGLPHLIMLFKATAGILDEGGHYGINLARAIGFPPPFTARAEEVADQLKAIRESKTQNSAWKMAMRRKLVLNLHGALKQARDSGKDEALLDYLKDLKESFISQMAKLED